MGHLDANTNADQLSRTGQTNGALPAQPAQTSQLADVRQKLNANNQPKASVKNIKGLLFQVTAGVNLNCKRAPKVFSRFNLWKIFHLNADYGLQMVESI